MALRALRYIVNTDGLNLSQSELSHELLVSFWRTRLQQPPAAYLVRSEDLSHFAGLTDLTVDRGRKHKAKPLAKLLLDQRNIPIIQGSYDASGQVARSIRALLYKALERDEHNLYIIGTSERIFAQLWQRAGKLHSLHGSLSDLPSSRAFRFEGKADGAMDVRSLLDLLPSYQIPTEFLGTFVGNSVEVQLVRQLVMRAAARDAPVLILGDTGSGKELIARSIHKYSARSAEKFVAVNCGAIPRDLFESELFGHKKGSFTDARFDKKGLWEITGRGTLFLDEVGDLSLEHQVKILRALEENLIRPIGEAREIRVNARVLSATNRDLFSMVQAGQFRQDLYYRLRSFLIRSPGLAEHQTDIPALAQHLWKRVTGDKSSELPDQVVNELRSYAWPGNARELRAVLSGLYSLFGRDGVGVPQLKAVFQLQGQSPGEARSLTSNHQLMQHRVDCLRHLRKVDEAVRACKVAVRPALRSGSETAGAESVQVSLRRRLQELEVLCMRPLLFHSEVTFSVVCQLKGKLSCFLGLLKSDNKVAVAYWKDEVIGDFKLVLTSVFQEIERLMANLR